MKRIIFTMVLVAALCLSATAQNKNIFAKPNSRWLEGTTVDPLWNWLKWADPLIGAGSATGTGTLWYVDSAVSNEGDGSSWTNARDTIEEAYDLASTGDFIYVAQGHAETLGTLVLDTAGITIVGIGQGEERPEITWDGTGDIITISGASNTISNLSFRAGVHAITTGINITADGDYTSILYCDWPEPSDNTFDFITAIQLAGASDYVTVAYNTYKHADAVGPAEFIDGGATALTGLAVIGNLIHTESTAAPIFSDQTDLEMFIAYNVITNMTTGIRAIDLGAAATGWLIGNKTATDAIGTSVDPGACFIDETTVWSDFDLTDVTGVPIFTNNTGVNRWGVTELAQIEGEATDALEADHLDHFFAVSVADEIVNDSYGADIAASDGDWSGFDKTTDSLEAIRDAIDAITGVGFRGDATSAGGTATFISTDMTGFGDDYFNTNWKMIIVFDAGSAGAAPEGDVRDIVDYESSTGTFTVAPVWSGAQSTASGDKALVLRDQELNPHDTTILRGSDKVTYVDSARAGTPDVGDLGDTWDLAYLTITAALDAAVASGEVIYVAPGHSETLVAAYSIDDAGVSIIGLGEGSLQPLLTLNHVDAQLDVTVADVLIQNIRIESQLDNVKIGIDISGTGDGAHIKNCNFTNETTSDELLIAINLTTGSDDVIIEDCTFLSVGAASTECIKAITGACDNLQIIDNWIRGDYTVAAIWSDQALTDLLISGNIVQQETAGEFAVEFTSTALGSFDRNRLYSDDYASMLDPGSLLCTDNWGVDALDQQAIRIPLSAETSDITAVEDGSDLERLEWLQVRSDAALGRLGVDQATANVFYVDSVAANGGDGTSWSQSEDTLKAAIDDATDSTGAIIFLAANHAENIGASVAIDCPGVTIYALGVSNARGTLTFTATGSVLAHTVANVKWVNVLFVSGTADTTVGITLDGSSDGAVFVDCEFRSTSGFEFVSSVTLASACDDIRFTGCKFNNATSGVSDATGAITNIAGITDGMTIEDCEFFGAWTAAAIVSDDADTDVMVRDNFVQNSSTGIHAIEFSAAALGTLSNNLCYADTLGTIIDSGSLKCFGNKEVSTIDSTATDYPLIPGKTYALTKTDGIAGDDDLFLVAGGDIMITHFHGYIDEDIGAACTMKVFLDHADKDYDFSTAVDIQAGVDGGQVLFSAANPAVLSIVGIGAVGSGLVSNPWYCAIGSIETDVSDANTGGNIKWSMVFIPLTTGVSVTVQ